MKLLSWNTQGTKEGIVALLEEASYDLLAIQEPWINRQTQSTYCPRSSRYHLVHKPGARVALYVSKKFEISQWNYEAEGLWAWVRFLPKEGFEGLEVWSIYNPPDTKDVPALILQRTLPPVLPTVLAGDFNLHHPLWDEFGRYDTQAEQLLNLALQWDLELKTPPGAITREPQGDQRARPSTIDHFWASAGLQTTYYGLEVRGKADHYPQVLAIAQGPRPEPAAAQGWQWKKLPAQRVEAEAKLLLAAAGGPSGLRRRASTVEGLREAFSWLTRELTRIAETWVPRKKPNRGFQSPWWSQKVTEKAEQAREAERAYKAVPTPERKSQLNRAQKELSATLQTERTASWRASVQSATDNEELLWKLERWARLRSFSQSAQYATVLCKRLAKAGHFSSAAPLCRS